MTTTEHVKPAPAEANATRRFRRSADVAAPCDRDAQITRHLPLARHLAWRYRDSNESFDDLLQVATVGLIKAVDRFDADRGFAFSSFATPYILGELRRHLQNAGWAVHVPRPLREFALRMDAARSELTERLSRSPTVAELAAELGVSDQSVLEALQAGSAYRATSFDILDEDTPPALTLVDRGYDRAEDRATLRPLLRSLSPIDQQVILLYFHEGHTQHQIASQLGISQMQVSRRLTRSLRELQDLAHPCAA